MALLYFVDEKQTGSKQHMSKVAARRYIEKVQKKADDNLALAERWGAKAVEFEQERDVLQKRYRIIKWAVVLETTVLGVMIGYHVLLSI